MARVEDRWTRKDRTRTPEYGKGSRWRAVWTEAGEERKKSFRTKDAAAAHLTYIEHHQRAGTYVNQDRGRVFIRDLLPEWVAGLAHLKASTLAATESDVRATILPYWGDSILADISRADVQAWVSGMDKAARTVDTIYGRFRNFLNWCVTEGKITTSPAKKVNLPRGNKRPHVYLTIRQLKHLADSIDPHYKDFVTTLALTGLRIGELCELRHGDIDRKRRRANIARSVVYVRGTAVVDTPKNDKDRDVPLAPPVLAVIGAGARDDLLFATERGRRIRANNFGRRQFAAAITKARKTDKSIPAEMHVHDLRHTAASLAISAGANVKALQRMLGHASAEMTLSIYAGLFDSDLDDVADRLGQMFVEGSTLPEVSQHPENAA